MGLKDDCLRYAAELVRIAQETGDPSDKATLIEMANAWVALAERIATSKSLSHDDDN